jgi:uncharacterized protein YecE (DUF72 family)
MNLDEPKFRGSIRQLELLGEMVYWRGHGRNAKKWWHHDEMWERYEYLYTRDEVKEHAETIKKAVSKPGINKAFAFYNNHPKGNAPANAIRLSQELGLSLKAMPHERMLSNFPELAQIQPA